MIEFDDFLMVGCDQQNLTITDKDTGRTVGPYCNEVMPPKFISDSSKVVVETHTGDLEHEAESRGYMFRFWRVTEAVALQEKQLATQNEFAQADYMDRMNGFGQGMGPGGMWGMGRGPGMMDNGPLHPGTSFMFNLYIELFLDALGQGGGYPNYPNYGQPAGFVFECFEYGIPIHRVKLITTESERVLWNTKNSAPTRFQHDIRTGYPASSLTSQAATWHSSG